MKSKNLQPINYYTDDTDILNAIDNLESANAMIKAGKAIKDDAVQVLIPWMQDKMIKEFSAMEDGVHIQLIPGTVSKSVDVTQFKKNLADAGVDIGTIVSCESRAKKETKRSPYIKTVEIKKG